MIHTKNILIIKALCLTTIIFSVLSTSCHGMQSKTSQAQQSEQQAINAAKEFSQAFSTKHKISDPEIAQNFVPIFAYLEHNQPGTVAAIKNLDAPQSKDEFNKKLSEAIKKGSTALKPFFSVIKNVKKIQDFYKNKSTSIMQQQAPSIIINKVLENINQTLKRCVELFQPCPPTFKQELMAGIKELNLLKETYTSMQKQIFQPTQIIQKETVITPQEQPKNPEQEIAVKAAKKSPEKITVDKEQKERIELEKTLKEELEKKIKEEKELKENLEKEKKEKERIEREEREKKEKEEKEQKEREKKEKQEREEKERIEKEKLEKEKKLKAENDTWKNHLQSIDSYINDFRNKKTVSTQTLIELVKLTSVPERLKPAYEKMKDIANKIVKDNFASPIEKLFKALEKHKKAIKDTDSFWEEQNNFILEPFKKLSIAGNKSQPFTRQIITLTLPDITDPKKSSGLGFLKEFIDTYSITFTTEAQTPTFVYADKDENKCLIIELTKQAQPDSKDFEYLIQKISVTRKDQPSWTQIIEPLGMKSISPTQTVCFTQTEIEKDKKKTIEYTYQNPFVYGFRTTIHQIGQALAKAVGKKEKEQAKIRGQAKATLIELQKQLAVIKEKQNVVAAEGQAPTPSPTEAKKLVDKTTFLAVIETTQKALSLDYPHIFEYISNKSVDEKISQQKATHAQNVFATIKKLLKTIMQPKTKRVFHKEETKDLALITIQNQKIYLIAVPNKTNTFGLVYKVTRSKPSSPKTDPTKLIPWAINFQSTVEYNTQTNSWTCAETNVIIEYNDKSKVVIKNTFQPDKITQEQYDLNQNDDGLITTCTFQYSHATKSWRHKDIETEKISKGEKTTSIFSPIFKKFNTLIKKLGKALEE